MLYDLIIRNAQTLAGAPISIGITAGIVTALGKRVDGHGPELDGEGRAALRGLHDHHIHLLASAAAMDSVDLSSCTNSDAIRDRLQNAAQRKRAGQWIRATGYDERVAGLPDAQQIDAWISSHPIRIQDRTGAYWLLNSIGVDRLGSAPWDSCVEVGGNGAPTGRIRRGDAWLRERISSTPPDLNFLGTQLARWGVTAVTDATAHNGPEEAALLVGSLPQRLTLMGSEALCPGPGYTLGPLKLHYDEAHLPDTAIAAARIADARVQQRPVAAHCVALAELLFYLAALDEAGGARPGDRIEHGGIIPASMIADIVEAGLIVVSNPGFIHDRGDRYLAEIGQQDWPDLYRLASLQRAGVIMRAGSDAPYGNANPWIAVRAAMDRKTRSGHEISPTERVSVGDALNLFGSGDLALGDAADIALVPIVAALDGDTAKITTLIGGRITPLT